MIKATLIIKINTDDEERAAERAWDIAKHMQSAHGDVVVAGVERVDPA